MVVLHGRVLDAKKLSEMRNAVAQRARPTLAILQNVPWLEE
jgi:hypothetical protein